MNINPHLYNESNLIQRDNAKELLTRFEEQFRNRKVKTIVDVGFGTGNVSSEILRSTGCDKLIAFDNNELMIEFARKHYANEKLLFIVADATDDWSNDFAPLQEQITQFPKWKKHFDHLRNIEKVETSVDNECRVSSAPYAIITRLDEQATINEYKKFHPIVSMIRRVLELCTIH
ncbi:phosphoethanolamine N-methyltransferase-like protein [Leptotrombidium deliense]|uniref:Phosphoethanolamine N-methyltransferase-like protein n=1 Tax=Leptotrombidium deliense TaxID=299467 RepID=A0A443S1V1_9ACAR|nr:phosphoethanolamine N-methyltransferase-like protein [Leptotrombidium deliense]